MEKTPTTPPKPEPTPLERMKALTRRIVAVPKSEALHVKAKGPKRKPA